MRFFVGHILSGKQTLMWFITPYPIPVVMFENVLFDTEQEAIRACGAGIPRDRRRTCECEATPISLTAFAYYDNIGVRGEAFSWDVSCCLDCLVVVEHSIFPDSVERIEDFGDIALARKAEDGLHIGDRMRLETREYHPRLPAIVEYGGTINGRVGVTVIFPDDEAYDFEWNEIKHLCILPKN